VTRYIPSLSSKQPRHSSAIETTGTIACVICKAEYAPSQLYGYLLQAPPIALESAFMSMCHFCFRCRRPACPHCWDGLHGICGECTEDARLPFRSDVGPLQGALFAPPYQPQKSQEGPDLFPLVCVRHGRFQKQGEISKQHNARRDERPPKHKQQPLPGEIAQAEHAETELSSTSMKDITELITRPDNYQDVIELDTQPAIQPRRTSSTESVVTIVLILILLFIVAIVILALLSPSFNSSVSGRLHVDIQAEIAYLLQLIRDLH
jgi:hypothetical protein